MSQIKRVKAVISVEHEDGEMIEYEFPEVWLTDSDGLKIEVTPKYPVRSEIRPGIVRLKTREALQSYRLTLGLIGDLVPREDADGNLRDGYSMSRIANVRLASTANPRLP